jgi:hypothetical protein
MSKQLPAQPQIPAGAVQVLPQAPPVIPVLPNKPVVQSFRSSRILRSRSLESEKRLRKPYFGVLDVNVEELSAIRIRIGIDKFTNPCIIHSMESESGDNFEFSKILNYLEKTDDKSYTILIENHSTEAFKGKVHFILKSREKP